MQFDLVKLFCIKWNASRFNQNFGFRNACTNLSEVAQCQQNQRGGNLKTLDKGLGFYPNFLNQAKKFGKVEIKAQIAKNMSWVKINNSILPLLFVHFFASFGGKPVQK